MAGNKTRDGIRLRDILRVAEEIGAIIREGRNHPYILNFQDLRPCPVATSTHARNMVAPWIARVTGRSAQECYEALRQGSWYN